MRVAMTHVDLPNEAKGGVAYQVHYLANALVERGHEVTMFTFSSAYSECRYGVHRYPSNPRLRKHNALYSFKMAAHLARTDFSAFDVLHTNGDNYLLSRRWPQVRTFYGSARDEAQSAVRLRRRMYQSLLTALEQRSTRVADINVGISEATRARIPAASIIVPCGVDLRRFVPGQKSDHPVVLFVGITGGRKRGRLLADVFVQQIRPRFPDAELWSVAEQPMERDGIVNLGKVSLETLVGLYQRAWVFCLPSTYEGFGVPYVEALACGTAVVATPNPGAKGVLEYGRFGLLAEDAQLGAAINHLLEDHDARKLLEDAGPERARAYSWDNVVKQYEEVYRRAIARHAQRAQRPSSAVQEGML